MWVVNGPIRWGVLAAHLVAVPPSPFPISFPLPNPPPSNILTILSNPLKPGDWPCAFAFGGMSCRARLAEFQTPIIFDRNCISEYSTPYKPSKIVKIIQYTLYIHINVFLILF